MVKSYTNFFTKVGKAISKTAKQGYKAVKNIFEWLQAQLDQFFEAIKNNNLGEWLNKKLDEFFGEEKADEDLDINIRNPINIVIGKFSKRSFDINNCGGEILNLTWENTIITEKGIDIISKHLSRFEEIPANKKMLKRLIKIENGNI